jgi:hypothetical protein
MTRLALAALLAAAAGCSDGPRRHDVSGVVTYRGHPVPTGEVRFEPDPARGGRGPGGFAKITDGRYRTEPGWGAVGGPHVVRIVAGSGRNASAIDPYGDPLFKGEYRTTADLPAGDAVQDFAIDAR